MIRVRAAGNGIDHRFGVAVIGGDDPRAAARTQRLKNSPEAGVDRLAGFDGCFELAGVADHVRICKIHDDGVEIALFDCVDDGIRNACGGHLRLQVVGGNFLRRDDDSLFAGEWLFDAAIEEIGDVRVFFRFGDAKILVLQFGEDVRKDVLEFFRADDVLEPRPGFFVLRHGNEFQIRLVARDRRICRSRVRASARVIWRARSARKLKKITASSLRIRPRGAAGFPGAASEVITAGTMNSSVTPVFVARAHRGNRVAEFAVGVAMNHRAVGLLDSFPAIVAIHCVVAADHGSDLADAVLAHFLFELADKIDAAVRRRVAAVHEAMNENAGDFIFARHAQKLEEMVDMRVNAAVA